MKIKFFGNGHVWDPGNNKTLCSFVGGEYATDKPEEIDILRKCKFREEVISAPAPVVEDPAPVVEVVVPAPAPPPVAEVVTSEPSVVRKDPEVPVEAEASASVVVKAPAAEAPHQPKFVRKNLQRRP